MSLRTYATDVFEWNAKMDPFCASGWVQIAEKARVSLLAQNVSILEVLVHVDCEDDTNDENDRVNLNLMCVRARMNVWCFWILQVLNAVVELEAALHLVFELPYSSAGPLIEHIYDEACHRASRSSWCTRYTQVTRCAGLDAAHLSILFVSVAVILPCHRVAVWWSQSLFGSKRITQTLTSYTTASPEVCVDAQSQPYSAVKLRHCHLRAKQYGPSLGARSGVARMLVLG